MGLTGRPEAESAVGLVVRSRLWDRRSHCETADTLDSEITVNMYMLKDYEVENMYLTKLIKCCITD